MVTYRMYGFSRDAQLQAIVNISWHKAFLLYMIWWKSPMATITELQPELFWRGSKCHCQVAQFLLHKYKRMIKSKFRASNTLLTALNMPFQGKNILVSLRKYLARTQQQWRTRLIPLLYSQISVGAPAKKTRPGLSLPQSVFLLSDSLFPSQLKRREKGTVANLVSKAPLVKTINDRLSFHLCLCLNQ